MTSTFAQWGFRLLFVGYQGGLLIFMLLPYLTARSCSYTVPSFGGLEISKIAGLARNG